MSHDTKPSAPDAIEVRGARVHNLKDVDVSVPLAELALRQRPPIPGVRSTFGTSTELLNGLRLVYSRLGRHRCPNGHRLEPTIDVALDLPLTCPECGAEFGPPGAESYAFNSDGACPRCAGTGIVREVDDAALVPDPSLSIGQGAVVPWKMFGLTVMPQVAAELGVRTDVPFSELTVCPDCDGTRLSDQARSTLVDGIDLAEATAKTLEELTAWLPAVAAGLPESMTAMADSMVSQLLGTARRLTELGLGYLTLDRAGFTLSTGERQRVALSRVVRNRTTGVLYVLDEPSIGLHPSNVDGLL